MYEVLRVCTFGCSLNTHCTVIAYVGPGLDWDLAAEIQKVLVDRSKTFASIFSRNKMLRRKLNARKAREQQSRGAVHSL